MNQCPDRPVETARPAAAGRRSSPAHPARRWARGVIGGLLLALGTPFPAAAAEIEYLVPDLAALARRPMTELPAPPPWVAVASPNLWKIEEVAAAFRQATPRPPQINYVRSAFVRLDYHWLVAYVDWFAHLREPLKIHFSDEQFDCDKFSRCFTAFADLLAKKGGEKRGSIAVGWAIVFNDQPFAGIAAGISHSVVIVGTNEGLFVVEPQNGTISALRDYPNRDSLLAVYL